MNSVLRRSSTQTRDGIWRHLRAALVVSEIAGAVALLAGGATLVHTLRALAAVDMGVRSSDALVAKVTLPRARYSSSNEIRLFYDRVMNELVSVPGVLLVGATSHLPGSLTDMGPSVVMSIEGKAALTDAASPYALRVSVTPRYFAAIGMDVVAGRPFIDADRGGRDLVAVISERYATGFRMEPRNALGHRVNIGLGEERWAVIVGVVKDVRAAGPESDWQPAVYVPVSQTALNATGYLVVDGGPQPKAMIPAIRRAVQRIDPTVPLYSISTVSDVQSEYLSTRRFAMMTISAFGSVGFGLAVLGLYSVVSYSVQLRAQEIAVRIALGATTADVRRQVMGSGLRQAAAGLALGIALAIALWKLTASYMPGLGPVRAIDIFVLSSVVLFVSLIATWIPSERAASIDPWIALRN